MGKYYDKVMGKISEIKWKECWDLNNFWLGTLDGVTVRFTPAKPTFKFLFISIKQHGTLKIYFGTAKITEEVPYDKSVELDSAIMELGIKEYLNDKKALEDKLG